MDLVSDVYDFFGTQDPAVLAADLIVAALLAAAIAFFILEAMRVLFDFGKREADVATEPAFKEELKPKALVKPAEILKPTAPESIAAMAKKYSLESVTIASADGLSIGSTGQASEEEAAIYSSVFSELKKTRPENYFYVPDKKVHLYSVEAGPSKVIGVARRNGAMTSDEAAAVVADTQKIIDKFAPAKKSA